MEEKQGFCLGLVVQKMLFPAMSEPLAQFRPLIIKANECFIKFVVIKPQIYYKTTL